MDMNMETTLRIITFDTNDYTTGGVARAKLTSNDIVNIPNVYSKSTFVAVSKELNACNDKMGGKLIVPWHKGSHSIVSERCKWRKQCPTVTALVSDMCNAFNVTPSATRVNIYGISDGTADAKPFHHDRSAFTPGTTENITLSLSLGATREIAFKYAKYKCEPHERWTAFPRKSLPPVIISNVCTSGSIYAFARDVNIEFQHGLLPDNGVAEERISIVVWGTKPDLDISSSRVSRRLMPTPFELGVRVRRGAMAKKAMSYIHSKFD